MSRGKGQAHDKAFLVTQKVPPEVHGIMQEHLLALSGRS